MLSFLRRSSYFSLLVLVVVFFSAPQWPIVEDLEAQIETQVEGYRFDFSSWLTQAAVSKISADLGANHDYLSDNTRNLIVRGYLGHLQDVLNLERELEQIYSDPDISNPEIEGESLRRRIEQRRAVLAELQPLAEAILQEQVAAVLLDEGFGVGGRIWPPVRMRLTPLPTLLVVSPRDRIEQLKTIPLEAGLPVSARAEIEAEIESELSQSAYVTNIGGLGVYPTMVIETTHLNFLVDVIAHEWSHNWFDQFPLGWSYLSSPEVRTINETAAGIIGREVGGEVIRRFYPDLVPTPPGSASGGGAIFPLLENPLPAPFDFRLEMHKTRVRVDELLAAGAVEEAEAYMEARRRIFVDNGYNLRVLNQAYFAFNGAYADEIGAAGTDPVGPLVNEIRSASPGLRDFMYALVWVTSFEGMQEVAADLGVCPAPDLSCLP